LSGDWRIRFAAIAALGLFAAAGPSLARASTAPPVSWCGTAPATADRPDAVAGRQVHVIYALPSDGVDRFADVGPGITTDLAATVSWWKQQDFTRAPRFDLAAFSCFPSMGALDISQVRLPQNAAYYYDEATRFDRIGADLVAAGFGNIDKKYLVYYDAPSLPYGACGQGRENPTQGGSFGYAEVYLAPNIESAPSSSGCGQIESPANRGGYSAIVATHELIHTFGALDTWSAVHPPHACPDSPAHACDNDLDIMQPAGKTYWLDNVSLDVGHDDYYAHSGSWWDVQDSPWLSHLNEPTYAVDITQGAGVQAVTSDLPGIACAAGEACHSTWDNGTVVVLTAAPADGYTRVVWGGACASAGASATCSLTMSANAPVTVSFLKALAVSSFSSSATRSRVQAVLTLSRTAAAGEASLLCRGTSGLKLAQHSISGTTATCAWTVPARLRGHRVTGRVEVDTTDGTTLARPFALKLLR
jgi:hypothetical protein